MGGGGGGRGEGVIHCIADYIHVVHVPYEVKRTWLVVSIWYGYIMKR